MARGKARSEKSTTLTLWRMPAAGETRRVKVSTGSDLSALRGAAMDRAGLYVVMQGRSLVSQFLIMRGVIVARPATEVAPAKRRAPGSRRRAGRRG